MMAERPCRNAGIRRQGRLSRCWTGGAAPDQARSVRLDERLSSRGPLFVSAVVTAVIIVPAMLILLAQTVRGERNDNRVAAQLHRDGVVTLGIVTKLRSPLRWHVFPSTASISYATESGVALSTWVPVSHELEAGDQRQVRYSRSDPLAARLAGDETPGRGRWKLVVIGGMVLAVLLIATSTLSELLRRRRE